MEDLLGQILIQTINGVVTEMMRQYPGKPNM